MGDGSGNFVNVCEIGVSVAANTKMAIRSKSSGSFHWYGGDHISNATSTTDYLQKYTSSQSRMGDANGQDTLYAIEFKVSGRYFIYLETINEAIKVSVAKTASKGDGYYLLPYNAKNDCDSDGGHKMKSITSVGTTNNAVYTSFSVIGVDPNNSATYKDYAINSYFNRANGTPISSISIDTSARGYVSVSSDKITIEDNGSYNFFVYNNGTQVSVTKNPLSDFFSLNSIPTKQKSGDSYIPHTSKSVMDANTTLILAVSFTASGSSSRPLLPSVDVVLDGSIGSGLSSYVKVACFYDTGSCSLGSCYGTLRGLIYGSNGVNGTNFAAFQTVSTTTSFAPVGQANITNDSTHWMYIVVDYDPSALTTMPSSTIANNLTFSLKVAQV